MKIVTFNIRCDWGQDGNNDFDFRKPHILTRIKSEKPEIICFQEVLPHVAKWLKENLVNYYVVGCGRSNDLTDEELSIAFDKSKYNLLELEVFWLSETPRLPGSRYEKQSGCPRICTMALFQDDLTKRVFRVYNVHLDHIGQEARELGLRQILETIKNEEFLPDVPAILLGDFNALPDSKELKIVKDYPFLVDRTTSISNTFHDFGRSKVPIKIDYILTHPNLACNSVGIWDDCIDGVYLSDHYPVWADLQLK